MICDLLSEILPALGKDQGDPAEALIGTLHAHAEALVKQFVGSRIEQTTYAEILPPGPGIVAPSDLASDEPTLFFGTVGPLQLRHTPVRSLVSVHETSVSGGGGWPDTALLDPSSYWLDEDEPGLSRSGLLYRAGGWPPVPRSVRVSYVGGWTPEELDDGAQAIKLAVKQATAKLFRETEAYFDSATGGAGIGPLVSEGIMGWTQAFHAESVAHLVGMQNDLPASVKALLQPFVNMGSRLGSLR